MNKKNENSLIIKESFSDDYSERKIHRSNPYRTRNCPKGQTQSTGNTGLTVKKPSHQRRILTGRLITLTLKHITQSKGLCIRRRNLSIPLSTVYG